MKKIKNIRVNVEISTFKTKNNRSVNASFKFIILNLNGFKNKKTKLNIILNQNSEKRISLKEIFFALVQLNIFLKKEFKKEFLKDLVTPKFDRDCIQYQLMEAKSGNRSKRRLILQKTNDKDMVVEQNLLLETKDGCLEKDLQNVSFYDLLLLLVIMADKKVKEDKMKPTDERIDRSINSEIMRACISKIEKEGGGFYDIVEFEDE